MSDGKGIPGNFPNGILGQGRKSSAMAENRAKAARGSLAPYHAAVKSSSFSGKPKIAEKTVRKKALRNCDGKGGRDEETPISY